MMSINVALHQPEFVTDTATNGGRLTGKLVVPTVGGAGNFSAVSTAERLSGVTKIRKFFAKFADAANPLVVRATVFLNKPSLLTDSRCYLVKGTQRDQQGDMATRKYATGFLHSVAMAGDTVLVVDFEQGNGANSVVQAGDKIAAMEGAIENIDLYAESVQWQGDRATITLRNGLLNDFTTSAAVASCFVDTDNCNTHVDQVAKSLITSTFDELKILTNNLGTLEQTITLSITGGTTFSVIADTLGTLPNGSTLADYAPINTDTGTPYFVIPATAWGGVGSNGETVVFQIHPAAVPFWIVQETLANAGTGIDAVYPSLRVEA